MPGPGLDWPRDPRRHREAHVPRRRELVTALNGPRWSSLHAKCIIVDERTLVTSANSTERAQSRNIEAGVLIEDRRYAQDLAGHWKQLVTDVRAGYVG